MRNQVRVIGGEFRGRNIHFKDASIRPTSDRVKETLFNWLNPYIVDANCLDLFAGSGSLGIEALSRGAQHAVFVDQEVRHLRAINDCIKTLGIDDQVDYINFSIGDCALSFNNAPFDIIFLDAPFNCDLVLPTVQQLIDGQCFAQGGLIYIESERTLDVRHDDLDLLKEKHTKEVAYRLLSFTR